MKNQIPNQESHYLLLKKKKSEEDYQIVKAYKTLPDAIAGRTKLLDKYPFSDAVYCLDWDIKIMSIYQIQNDKNLSYLLADLV